MVFQARGLRLDLPGREPLTLDLTVGAGQAVQLNGPSGCGKTTLLRMLARLDDPGAAQLSLDGVAAGSIDPQTWRRRVCYLAQRPAMLPGTVAENLRAGFGVRQAPRPPEGLDARGKAWLEDLGLAPGQLWEQDARTLSGGEASRVALCRALALEPRVLLCDEPTAGLDLEHGLQLASLLQRWLGQGGALVLVAHDPAPWTGLGPRKVALVGAVS